jgi:hypothetical protein
MVHKHKHMHTSHFEQSACAEASEDERKRRKLEDSAQQMQERLQELNQFMRP